MADERDRLVDFSAAREASEARQLLPDAKLERIGQRLGALANAVAELRTLGMNGAEIARMLRFVASEIDDQAH
jgi:hypothetical protein